MSKFVAAFDLTNSTIAILNVGAAVNEGVVTATAESDLTNFSGPQLVLFYNVSVQLLKEVAPADFGGLNDVKRFPSVAAGAKRLWANLEDLAEKVKPASAPQLDTAKAGPADAEQVAAKAVKQTKEPKAPKVKAEKAPKEPKEKAKRISGVVNLKPKSTIYACRAGSKQSVLVDMLSRPEGITFSRLHEAMQSPAPWAEVTTRAALSWDVNHIKGYGIKTVLIDEFEAWVRCDYDDMGSLPLTEALNALGLDSSAQHPDDQNGHHDEIRAKCIELGWKPEKNVPVYFLTYPAGTTAPLPHKLSKKAEKEAQKTEAK